ncbi:T3SS effector HopA1 family protein [Crossiella sp. CA198]|uniref:T3SS effector HopA1 family protein n=1 Tax=Crossiella sp. CA198 TaxID=3455607 RepID=UPI003F8D31DB
MSTTRMTRLLADRNFLDELWSLYREPDNTNPAAGKRKATRRLYARLHLGLTDDSGLEHAPASAGAAEFTAELRARLGGRRRDRGGWRLAGSEVDGEIRLRRQDGLLVTAEPGEYTVDADGAVTVRWPSLETGAMPGWVWFSGTHYGAVEDGEPLLRCYLGLSGADRGSAWADLVTALDETRLPFASKILTQDTARPDSVVIYCPAADLAEVRRRINAVVPHRIRVERPAGFGVPAGAGLAIAHPEAGERPHGSLGMQRSELIWQTMHSRGESFTAATDLRPLWRILDAQRTRIGTLLGSAGAADD